MITDSLELLLDPIVPFSLLTLFGATAVIVILWTIWCKASGVFWRSVTLVGLWVALANPTLTIKEKQKKPDVALVVIDYSESQKIRDRETIRDLAASHISKSLGHLPSIEIQTLRITDEENGTHLFKHLSRKLREIPAKSLSAVILITDGQIHDIAKPEFVKSLNGPFHLILTGRRDENDRRLIAKRATPFGIVGKDAKIVLQLIDPKVRQGELIPLSVTINAKSPTEMKIPANEPFEINMPINSAGKNIIEFVAKDRDGELSYKNNQLIHTITGVRDRLRVLLLSGEPHAGQRAWRTLLKSDPSIDLIHFTILRTPEKQDNTPPDELALISFPMRELFELKLHQFDLIIFDRFRRRGVLPIEYLENIVEYVENGGALLESSGPSFATRSSIARSPIGDILPTSPTGKIINRGFYPRLTIAGHNHPVTSFLFTKTTKNKNIPRPRWGRWFQQIDARLERGQVLLKGIDEKPLLVLDRVRNGRVAHILSDNIWLWRRGFEGGGPQIELLRRTVHWLMKEPELEENSLAINFDGTNINVIRNSIDEAPLPLTMIKPDKSKQTINLKQIEFGKSGGVFETNQIGLHKFTDEALTKLHIIGPLNSKEFVDLKTTDKLLGQIVRITKGGIYWAAENGLPHLRRIYSGRPLAGSDWMGLQFNNHYVVTGVKQIPLFPSVVLVIIITFAAAKAWRSETQSG